MILLLRWMALLVLAAACGTPLVADPSPTATPGPPDPLATAVPVEPTTVPPGSATLEPSADPEPAEPVLLGTFPVEIAPEASGITASAAAPGAFWLLDDGPGTTAVVAVGSDGAHLGTTTMNGVEGRDTEALSLAPCGAEDPARCLYVGDIGDNNANHDQIRVHRFAEPDPAGDRTVEVTTATFTYPDGPHNAEAMVVGPDGLPVVLTKEEDRVGVYRATAFGDGALESLGDLPLPDPATPSLSLFVGVVVTDASLSPDGRDLLVRTYDHAVRFTAPEGPADLAAVASWTATEVAMPIEPQGEAITWADLPGRPAGYVTASEGTGNLWFVPAPSTDP